MTDEELVSCLEALLFAYGKAVDMKTLQNILEIDNEKIKLVANQLKERLEVSNSGIQLIEINDGYQLATREEFYTQVCKLLDNRPKPSLSQAAMEVLAIVAYNSRITRAEIEKIRGVNSDSALNKLLEYGLLEESGRIDAPGRPMSFRTSDEFLRLFGYKSLKDMPELPELREDDGQLEIEEMNQEATNDGAESKNDAIGPENGDSTAEQNISENE